jgi:hypothetical protein
MLSSRIIQSSLHLLRNRHQMLASRHNQILSFPKNPQTILPAPRVLTRERKELHTKIILI